MVHNDVGDDSVIVNVLVSLFCVTPIKMHTIDTCYLFSILFEI